MTDEHSCVFLTLTWLRNMLKKHNSNTRLCLTTPVFRCKNLHKEQKWLVSISCNHTMAHSGISHPIVLLHYLGLGLQLWINSTLLLISIFDYAKEFSWLCRGFLRAFINFLQWEKLWSQLNDKWLSVAYGNRSLSCLDASCWGFFR